MPIYSTLRLVDAFCGVGGATEGYRRAADALGIKIRIIGVDIKPQPEYCGDEFYQMDAIKFLRKFRRRYDVAHASPPCQDHSLLTIGNRAKGLFDNHKDWIPATRAALLRSGKPWVMENVATAPLRADVELCGLMFGLPLFRHRLFEIHGFSVPPLEHPSHEGYRVKGYRHGKKVDGNVYGVYGAGGGKGQREEWQRAMGIYWTRNNHSLAEAIPPAFSEYVGKYLLKDLANRG